MSCDLVDDTATGAPGATRRGERADDVRTRSEALRTLARRGSARVIASCGLALLAVRAALGGAGVLDAVIVVAALAVAGVGEWVVHRHLFHAPEQAWVARRLGVGREHRRHHADPGALDTLLLRTPAAAVFVAVLGVVAAGVAVPLARVVGAPGARPATTAWLVAVLALGHYEWVHLLAHTRYRFRSRRYRRLARNHRVHHHRDDRSWFGVTSDVGDRLLGTRRAAAEASRPG